MDPLPVVNAEFQIALLLLVAVGGYLIAARIHQSAVVGEIILGLIVGPSVLGLITYTDLVSALAQMGAIIILFVIGFDFHFSDILKGRYLVIGVCGVILPWILGFLTAGATPNAIANRKKSKNGRKMIPLASIERILRKKK